MYINHVKSSEKYDMKIQHYHDAYEIYLQADGERYLFLDDICYTLKQGDLVIFKSRLTFTIWKAATLIFTKDMF